MLNPKKLYIKSKPNIIQLKAVLFAPFLYDFYYYLILNIKKTSTLGDDYTDFRIAAASIKWSTDSFPAITICKTPITDPLKAS